MQHSTKQEKNLSLKTGIFPTDWKMAKVIPTHESGSHSNSDTYRPLSVLPVISKIIEKIIHEQLITFLDGAIFVDLSKALDTTQCCFNGCQKSWNEKHNFSFLCPLPPLPLIQ